MDIKLIIICLASICIARTHAACPVLGLPCTADDKAGHEFDVTKFYKCIGGTKWAERNCVVPKQYDVPGKTCKTTGATTITPCAPASVINLAVTASGTTWTVTWDRPTTSAISIDDFQVTHHLTSASSGPLSALLTAETYTLSGIQRGMSYFVKVRTHKTTGDVYGIWETLRVAITADHCAKGTTCTGSEEVGHETDITKYYKCSAGAWLAASSCPSPKEFDVNYLNCRNPGVGTTITSCAPAAPTVTVVWVGDVSITYSLTGSTAASYEYDLYTTTPGAGPTYPTTTLTTDIPIAGLLPSTAYSLRVRGVSAGGFQGAWSPVATFTTVAAVPWNIPACTTIPENKKCGGCLKTTATRVIASVTETKTVSCTEADRRCNDATDSRMVIYWKNGVKIGADRMCCLLYTPDPLNPLPFHRQVPCFRPRVMGWE